MALEGFGQLERLCARGLPRPLSGGVRAVARRQDRVALQGGRRPFRNGGGGFGGFEASVGRAPVVDGRGEGGRRDARLAHGFKRLDLKGFRESFMQAFRAWIRDQQCLAKMDSIAQKLRMLINTFRCKKTPLATNCCTAMGPRLPEKLKPSSQNRVKHPAWNGGLNLVHAFEWNRPELVPHSLP